MDDDGDLVRRAASGDEAAFAAIWRRHRDPVYRFAAWMLGERAAAEDVTQEAFLALLRHPERFDAQAASLKTYLFAIARNLCRKHLRRTLPECDLDFDGGAEDGVVERLVAAESAEALRAAIAALPVPQREALFLFEFEELSLAEAAAQLGLDPNAVKARLHRARERLRRELSWMKI